METCNMCVSVLHSSVSTMSFHVVTPQKCTAAPHLSHYIVRHTQSNTCATYRPLTSGTHMMYQPPMGGARAQYRLPTNGTHTTYRPSMGGARMMYRSPTNGNQVMHRLPIGTPQVRQGLIKVPGSKVIPSNKLQGHPNQT
jgi:hypothetical protein